MNRTLSASLALVLAASTASATDIHVDNRIGSDGYNGQAAKPLDGRIGPVKSIGAALRLCNGGDTVIIENTGDPYYESLSIYGAAHSGDPTANFDIVGNGAVVSGARLVPPDFWRHAGDDIWQLNTHRKGHVLLLVDGKTVPRHAGPPADVPLGQFCMHRGLVHFKGDAANRPPDMNFAFAYHDVGLTLYKVQDVTIRDLNFQHFRLDGIAAPGSARRITLDNVTSFSNGRAGVSLDGISTVVVRGGAIQSNVEHSVLVQGTSAIGIEGTEIDAEPTVVE